MKKLVTGVLIAAVATMLGACQSRNAPYKIGSRYTTATTPWSGEYQTPFDNVGGSDEDDDEPAPPSWETSIVDSVFGPSRIDRIRHAALGVAPVGVDIETLSRDIDKRREAEIDCIPVELRMILNTVGWHYGRHVHVQSGYRTKRHNRAVGGARGSFHLSCEAVDIQVEGIGKFELAGFLKALPGRGGVGTYCNVSTVHIDIGPKRDWHYGCRGRSSHRFAMRPSLRR